MEDQSPFITSSNPDRDLYGTADEGYPGQEHPVQDRKPWDDLDVLDLTGGAGGFPPSRQHDEEEDEKPSYSDSLEPSPEEEEPSSISSDPHPAAPVMPSAPLEEEERPPVPRRAPSGSVDENLFPLPAASVPLMLSSAGKVLDLQQPYSTVPAGQEELASMLLESSTSAPSLSPLSADSAKEHIVSVACNAKLTAPEALQEPVREMHDVSRTTGDLAFTEKVGNQVEPDYSEVAYHTQSSILSHVKEDLIFSEKGYVVEHPTSQQETVSEDLTQLYSQSAKEMFSGMLKAVGPPHEEFSDIKVHEEQYVDFKPFESTRAWDVGYQPKAEKFDSNVNSLNFETVKRQEEKYDEDNEVDLSDDISPITPEVGPESPGYEMFAPLEKSIQFAVGGSYNSGNYTDEKKMEEFEVKATSESSGLKLATVNPFYEQVEKEGEYVSTETVSGSQLSKSEGLTPDIVQEAYESETYDSGIAKPGYESKIDLVQTTAKSVQENLPPTTPAPALFQGTDSISSPVLPDIVMEAPLTSASVSLEASAFKPDVSPVGSAPAISEEKIKFESEKPPSYEEAVSKTGSQDKGQAAAGVEKKRESPGGETETNYISIACDLIKETIPTETSALDFSKTIKDEFESQFQHFDDSSPESEQSEPSYKHWEPQVVSREVHNTVMSSVKPANITPEKDLESDLRFREPSPDKAYWESFQPDSKISKPPTDILASGPVTEMFKNQEKPLQMEEFGISISSGKTPSPKYSPIIETSPVSVADDFTIKAPRDVPVELVKEIRQPEEERKTISIPEKKEDLPSALFKAQSHGKTEEPVKVPDQVNDFTKAVDLSTKDASLNVKEAVAKPQPPAKKDDPTIPSTKEKKEVKNAEVAATGFTPTVKNSVVDLLYWRDIKKSGAVFGASLFLLLSLTVFSIVSVTAYIALALLSVSISFRIYKGVLQAIQKSDEGHPFRSYLESDVAVSEDLVQKYCNVALGHVNCTIKELRRLFLVEDLVDSLKFAVLMWVFTYIGALFNGLTLLILALVSLFSIPVIYERHQTQVDHYLSLINKNVKSISDLVLAKIPGLKRKTE
ncbi:reticulon-4 [Pelodytes ibericus]